MIVQRKDDYILHLSTTWIDQETVRVAFWRECGDIDLTPVEFYLHPTELAAAVDSINDTLCR